MAKLVNVDAAGLLSVTMSECPAIDSDELTDTSMCEHTVAAKALSKRNQEQEFVRGHAFGLCIKCRSCMIASSMILTVAMQLQVPFRAKAKFKVEAPIIAECVATAQAKTDAAAETMTVAEGNFKAMAENRSSCRAVFEEPIVWRGTCFSASKTAAATDAASTSNVAVAAE